VRLLGEVGGLYRFPATRAEAAALLALAGRATHSTDPAIAAAALRAVGETGASEAVELLKPFLRARTGQRLQATAAIRAAGTLRRPALVAPLVDLAKTSSDLVLADQALLALGEYCRAETAMRKRVTDRTLSICSATRKNRRRWRRLRAPGLRALQRLVGRRLNSVPQFADFWRFRKAQRDPFATASAR